MNDSKPWYTSKLVWLGIITSLLPVLDWASGQDIIANNPWVMFAIGAATVLLRSVTTNALRIMAVLACLLPASILQAADVGFARSENFIVLASTQPMADQVLSSAEHHRRQLAIEWLGGELPAGAGRTAITAKLDPTKNNGLTWPKRDNSGKLHHVFLNIPDAKLVDAMVCHEMAHVVFNTYRDEGLPAWIEEGAASFGDDPERVAIRQRSVAGFRASGFPRLEFLFSETNVSSSAREQYAAAASVTEFLLAKGDKPNFVRFGVEAQQYGWQRALHSCYGIRSVQDLQGQWVAWELAR